MANDKALSINDFYATKVLLNAAVPLLRVVVEDYPNLSKKFKGKNFVFQVSVIDDFHGTNEKLCTYFVIKDGVWTAHINECHASPNVEFSFSKMRNFVLFFSGRSKTKLPKIKCKGNFFNMVSVLLSLLKMSSILTASDIPADENTQRELVKLYFYLLPNGISQLNKVGHKDVTAWTKDSPDRIWTLKVKDDDELESWIRIADGNSKSGRGKNKRCEPFLMMEFDTIYHALEILMDKAEMIEYLSKSYLRVYGAPELAAALGNHMFLVGDYAKALYLDK